MICLAVLVGMLFSAVASAEIVVGVKQGDWIEYRVTVTGDVPEEHNADWGKIEIIAVEGKKIDIKITSRYSDGTEETLTSTPLIVIVPSCCSKNVSPSSKFAGIMKRSPI